MKFQRCQTAGERFPWSTLPQGQKWKALLPGAVSKPDDGRKLRGCSPCCISAELSGLFHPPGCSMRCCVEPMPPLHDVCRETRGECLQSSPQARSIPAGSCCNQGQDAALGFHVAWSYAGGDLLPAAGCTGMPGAGGWCKECSQDWKSNHCAAAPSAAQLC